MDAFEQFMRPFQENIYLVVPVPKPRMTKSDKWKKRDCVQRYWAFKDECALRKIQLPECGAHVVFHIPMPKSWSKKKRTRMIGQPHQQRPDIDNYTKAIMDAVYGEDSGVWDIRATKVWADFGGIEIKRMS